MQKQSPALFLLLILLSLCLPKSQALSFPDSILIDHAQTTACGTPLTFSPIDIGTGMSTKTITVDIIFKIINVCGNTVQNNLLTLTLMQAGTIVRYFDLEMLNLGTLFIKSTDITGSQNLAIVSVYLSKSKSNNLML